MKDEKPLRPETPRGVEAVLRRAPDGRWVWKFRVRWSDPVKRPNGSSPRRAQELPTIPAALAFKERVRLARTRDEAAELTAGDSTLADFVEHEWWPYAGRDLERSTLNGYASVYNNHILPHVGELRLRQITAPRIVRLRETLLAAGLRPPTVRRALVIMQAICRYAVEQGAMPINPVRDVTKPAVRRRLAIKLPSPVQIEALLDQLEPESRMLAELIAYQGLRPQEALALERRHRGNVTLLIEQKLVDGHIRPGQKTGRRRERTHRSPTLYQPVADRLDEHLARRPRGAHTLVFPGPDGHPWTEDAYSGWRRNVFKPAVKRAGLEISRPYDLRHACASLMLHAGVPLREIAEHMGHSVVTLSTYYAHLIADLRGQESIPVEQQILAARRPA